MKFVVVSGFQTPSDSTHKQRYAVILGMLNGRLAIAPCTTYPARKGLVPYGSALITNHSPAYAGTGFKAEQVAISIRDVGLYNIDSSFVRQCQQVGSLDTSKDLRFQENLKDLMVTYDLLHCHKEYI